MYKMNKHTELLKSSYIHLCGPTEDSKLKFIAMLNSTPSII